MFERINSIPLAAIALLVGQAFAAKGLTVATSQSSAINTLASAHLSATPSITAIAKPAIKSSSFDTTNVMHIIAPALSVSHNATSDHEKTSTTSSPKIHGKFDTAEYDSYFNECGYLDLEQTLISPSTVQNCIADAIGTKSMWTILDHTAEHCKKTYSTHRIHVGLFSCGWDSDNDPQRTIEYANRNSAAQCFIKSLPINGGVEAYGGDECVAAAILKHRHRWGGPKDRDLWGYLWRMPDGYDDQWFDH